MKSKSRLNESLTSDENDTSIDWDKKPNKILNQVIK